MQKNKGTLRVLYVPIKNVDIRGRKTNIKNNVCFFCQKGYCKKEIRKVEIKWNFTEQLFVQ